MASESPGGQGNPETGKARATQLDAAAPQEKGVPLKPRGLAGLLGTSAAIEPKATNLVASVVEDLKLARIKIDASVQCRAVLNKGIVANYAERMAAGDKFPPGVVFRVSGCARRARRPHRPRDPFIRRSGQKDPHQRQFVGATSDCKPAIGGGVEPEPTVAEIH